MKNVDKISPAQSRAARGFLSLTQTELAAAAGLGQSTVIDFERERRLVSDQAIDAIRTALERLGIVFLPEGVHGEAVAYHTAKEQ